MKVIGIMGGVGSGKSQVMNYLKEAYGAALILTDQVGHLVMEQGTPCYERIVEFFGPEVLDPKGDLIRSRIAERVFKDPAQLDALNRIVHPAVKKWVLEKIESCREEGADLLFLESALLLEEKYNEICDEVWYVYADEKVRIQRLMEGRGYTEEKSRSIMTNQLSEEAFRMASDFVLDNGGTFEKTIKLIDQRLKNETL